MESGSYGQVPKSSTRSDKFNSNGVEVTALFWPTKLSIQATLDDAWLLRATGTFGAETAAAAV